MISLTYVNGKTHASTVFAQMCVIVVYIISNVSDVSVFQTSFSIINACFICGILFF